MDSENILSLARNIQETMVHKQKTLALAESCTGGYVSHILTQTSGSSKFFLGSFITYADDLKRDLLQVSASTLLEEGAVSEEVVLQMVQGVFANTSADYALAISGVAGPEGGSAEKPVGTVWIAVGEKNKEIQSFCLHLKGTRLQIIQEATFEALRSLKESFCQEVV